MSSNFILCRILFRKFLWLHFGNRVKSIFFGGSNLFRFWPKMKPQKNIVFCQDILRLHKNRALIKLVNLRQLEVVFYELSSPRLNTQCIYPISNILIMVATFFCSSALCCKVCNHKHKDQVPCSRPCTYFNWANFGHQFLTFYSALQEENRGCANCF